MSEIRVRRSGLITFAIKLGSTLTGLAFIVLVTSNLTQADFGLWQLISRVVGYVIFAVNILNFWTLRYKARGAILGRTVLFGAAVFSAVLAVVYIVVAYGVAASVSGQAEYSSTLHYFLISTPQVPLYIFAGVIESMLWGYVPQKASFGFGIYEIAKVAIGGVAVAVLHLSLTGAIIAVIGAQIIQIATTAYMTRKEYSDKLSIPTIAKMVKTGWIAVLNQISPLVINFDFLIVAILTASTLPLALYGAAFTYGSIVTYSGWIAYGLYAGLLSGIDPRRSANQVLELQYLFVIPMVLGEIILAYPLLHLFQALYTQAVPILWILSVASALGALSLTFDNIITGTDTTDASNRADFSIYLRSKLFLVAKINIIISFVYLGTIFAISQIYGAGPANTVMGFPRYTFLGILWALGALGMWAVSVGLKSQYVRAITKISPPRRTSLAFLAGALGYSIILYFLSQVIQIRGGAISQALFILLMGAIALAAYAAIILSLSDSMRALVRYAISSLRS